MSDPADVLKVSPDAPLDEVKRAYRRAALAHHPDQNPHPEAARHFRRLTEAYRILEARAREREPRRPRVVPPAERLGFVIGDLASLVRRWPPQRWSQSVDGLPAVVWVAGALEVLAASWPGLGAPEGVDPSPEGISQALEGWKRCLGANQRLPDEAREGLERALEAVEGRIKALERPRRSPR